MSKFNLVQHLNLPRLCLLGLANLLLLPMVGIHSANAQSNRFFCQSYRGTPTTLNQSSGGTRPVITWTVRADLCDPVSRRFEVARSNGNLNFIMVEDKLVCGTNRDGGDCRQMLFGTDVVQNAQGLARMIRGGTDTDSRFITQSNGREYFNLELYLETVPMISEDIISLPVNQEASEKK